MANEQISNKSYGKIYEAFELLFPEFKKSVKEWTKMAFDKEERSIHILLKNGCGMNFGTVKDGDGEWTWNCMLDPSDKTKEKLGIVTDDEDEPTEE